VNVVEEKESILYIILLAVTMLIIPGTLGNDSPFYEFSRLVIVGTIIFLAIAMILIAVKNIPFLTPYIPLGLADNIIKLLAWIGVFLAGILIVVINLLNYIGG
jgi:prepilin signal peptidase PulO-like enzyme (type II secretory pathway)